VLADNAAVDDTNSQSINNGRPDNGLGSSSSKRKHL
jgi:hypothetical protein